VSGETVAGTVSGLVRGGRYDKRSKAGILGPVGSDIWNNGSEATIPQAGPDPRRGGVG